MTTPRPAPRPARRAAPARPGHRPATAGRSTARIASLGLAGLVILLAVSGLVGPIGTAVESAGAQSPEERVPCTVALVVGCVTTVDGAEGPVTVTLDPPDDDSNGDATGGADGTSVDGDADEEGDSSDEDADGGLQSRALVTSDGLDSGEGPPVHSGVDPWERGGLSTNFGTGSIPISHYQIGADTSGVMGVPDPLDSFVASQTNWAFTTSTFLVLLATNTLDWAFEFPLAGDLVGRAGILAQDYTIDFFGFGLSTSVYGLALSVTMVVAGFKAVTKGVIVAGSEVLLAFAAYVVLIVLTLTSSFGDAGLKVASISSDLSGSIASFAAGQDRQDECAAALAINRDGPSVVGTTASTSGATTAPPAADSAACSFGYSLQRSLVELPYQNLQWGQVLDGVDGKERCAEINQALLAEGPWGNANEPRERMGAIDECKENADFNSQATYIRLGIASANAVTAALVTLLVMVVAAMLLWQQIKLLFLTAILPHTLVFAILPGRSRALAWRWLEQLIGVVVRTVILALGLVVWLSLFSLIVHEQLTFRGIFLSLFASTAMAVAGFYGLYKLGGMTRRVNPARTPNGEGDGARTGGGGGGSTGDGEGRGERRRTAVRTASSAMRTVRARRSGASGNRDPIGAGRS